MAISTRNPQTAADNNSGSTTLSSYVVSSGATALIVCAVIDTAATAGKVTGVTFDGDALTLNKEYDGNLLLSVWKIDNPTAKTGDIVVTAGGTYYRSVIAFELTSSGVVSYTEVFDTDTSAGGATSLASTISSSTSNFVVSLLGVNNPPGTIVPSGTTSIAEVGIGVKANVGTTQGASTVNANWAWDTGNIASLLTMEYEEASASTTGTFDLPDVTTYTTDTAGAPFTSASHTITATLGDGTDTADLGVTYSPKSGYAVQEIASAVTTTGSVFEDFVGTITDTSQVYYPTADNTAVDATGIITTDSTTDIDMFFWDASDETWKPFEVLIESTSSGDGKTQIRNIVSNIVKPMIR